MSTLRFSRKQLCVPYALFLICFVVAPLIVIIYYAFTNGEGQFSLENLTGFFTSPNTIGTLAYSFATPVYRRQRFVAGVPDRLYTCQK